MGATHYNSVLSTSDAALFTPTTADVILSSVIAINGTGSAATVSLSVHRGNGQTETLAAALSVPANSAQEIVNDIQTALHGVLLRGSAGGATPDSLHGSAGTASAVSLLAFE